MPIHKIFSKRQNALRKGSADVFIYDDIPETLRVQIVFILKDAIGQSEVPFMAAHKVLCRELGFVTLGKGVYKKWSNKKSVITFFCETKNYEHALDVIEVTFRMIDIVIRDDRKYQNNEIDGVCFTPDQAISELNERFKEHQIGYQYEAGQIIRLDSSLFHAEIVKPTLSLVKGKTFAGANDEYLNAHDHYRHGRNKECLNECLKAFESTLKIICTEKGWSFDPLKHTAKNLIQICFDNELVPSYYQNQLTSLQQLLTSGIPTLRNKTSGHGQGQQVQLVDDHIARYGLNLTGTNIIFVIEQSGIK